MSAAVFTSAKSAIAKLALVFLLWCGCLFGRRVAGRVRCGWSHFLETVQRKADHRSSQQNNDGEKDCDIVPFVTSHRF